VIEKFSGPIFSEVLMKLRSFPKVYCEHRIIILYVHVHIQMWFTSRQCRLTRQSRFEFIVTLARCGILYARENRRQCGRLTTYIFLVTVCVLYTSVTDKGSVQHLVVTRPACQFQRSASLVFGGKAGVNRCYSARVPPS
jgi:hypothetical protein